MKIEVTLGYDKPFAIDLRCIEYEMNCREPYIRLFGQEGEDIPVSEIHLSLSGKSTAFAPENF